MEESVGDYLRQLRLEKKFSLEDVADVTKISLANLRAIESMDYQKLPADTFVKGLLTLYGNHLGGNGSQLAERFLRNRYAGGVDERICRQYLSQYSLAPKRLAEPSHVSSAASAGILLFVIVLSFVGFCFYTSWNPFAFLTSKIPGLSYTVVNAFHPADPASSSGAHKKNLNLQARFLKETKVILLLDEQESLQQVYSPDTTAYWSADKKIQVEFFQPDCAELQLNGTSVSFPPSSDGRYILHLPASTTPGS